MADNNVLFVAGNICRHLACALDQSKVMAAAREIAAHFAAQGQNAEPVHLEHVACAEDGGKLRWMTGRKPRDCELYAMPDGGHRSPRLYAHPPSAQAEYLGCDECDITHDKANCPSAAPAEPVSGADGLPYFAHKIIEKLARADECFSEGEGADIGRHWLDMLTQLGLLNRVQINPAIWEITVQGEEVLHGHSNRL